MDREEFESLRRVRPGDDLDRKLRAFWYPPHPGAVVEVDGRELTLVDEALLGELAQRLPRCRTRAVARRMA